jgi:hypothetical protein
MLNAKFDWIKRGRCFKIENPYDEVTLIKKAASQHYKREMIIELKGIHSFLQHHSTRNRGKK